MGAGLSKASRIYRLVSCDSVVLLGTWCFSRDPSIGDRDSALPHCAELVCCAVGRSAALGAPPDTSALHLVRAGLLAWARLGCTRQRRSGGRCLPCQPSLGRGRARSQRAGLLAYWRVCGPMAPWSGEQRVPKCRDRPCASWHRELSVFHRYSVRK